MARWQLWVLQELSLPRWVLQALPLALVLALVLVLMQLPLALVLLVLLWVCALPAAHPAC